MFYLNIYLQYTFSSWPMTTISSFLSLRACIASAATAPAVIRLGKHLVTVTTILEETMKAELKEAFRVYDRDGAGFITTDQLREDLKNARRL